MWRLLFCSILFTSPLMNAQNIRTLIIDTDGKHSYYYRALQELARSCNFDCTYKNIYDMLESPSIDPKTSTLFFFASPRFVQHLNHELSHDILGTLKSFAQKHNKLIILLLPNYASPQHLTDLIQKMPLSANISAQTLAHLYLKHIGHPNAQSGKVYGTSLINKCTGTKSRTLPQLPANMLLLPHKKISACAAACVQPLCLTVYNKIHNNLIALMPATDITFADIAENFHKNPQVITDRNSLLEQAQQLLWELKTLHANHILPTQNKPALPACFTKKHIQKSKPFSAAWLEPKDFYLHEEPKTSKDHIKQASKSGYTFLSNCDLDVWWFEVNPEWYFSPSALYKQHRDIVMNTLKTIGSQLQQRSNINKKKPQIFIGSDITSNFNGQKPQCYVCDLYGTEYPNIPSPFDIEHFWQQELLTPFKKCYTELKDTTPIDGLFLDFEMYHAPKQASSYHDLMDFSACAWRVFARIHKDAPTCSSVRERVTYLKKNKLFDTYFTTLTNAVRDIGTYITKQVTQINPALHIAIYAPTLPSSWFYRGITQGLSSKERPLTMATFNTDYALHHDWLNAHDMYITHGTAFMMSKLQHKSDFNTVKNLSQDHDFIWYNRPSRQLYQSLTPPPTNTWWQAEYSPLENNVIAHGVATLNT